MEKKMIIFWLFLIKSKRQEASFLMNLIALNH